MKAHPNFVEFMDAISNLLNTSCFLKNKESRRQIGRVGYYISKVRNNIERNDIGKQDRVGVYTAYVAPSRPKK